MPWTLHISTTLVPQCFVGEDHTATDRSAEGEEALGVLALSSVPLLRTVCVCVSVSVHTYAHTHTYTQTLSVCLSVRWALWVGRELRCRDVCSEDETAFLTGSI